MALPAQGARFDVQVFFSPQPSVVANAYFLTSERAKKLEPAMREAVQLITREIDENFQVGGRPAWEALADSTVERKERDKNLAGDLEQILVRSGVLWSEATDPGNWDIARAGFGGTVAQLVDPTAYGHFHIEGTRLMPQRNYADVPDEVLDQIEQIFVDFVTQDF